MPDCLKCGVHFPNKMFIEGKIRFLHRRKYCLDCSSYGQHNTTKLEQVPGKIAIHCNRCGKIYDYKKSKGHTLTLCNSCYVNQHKRSLKAWASEYMGGRCAVCGYNRCIQAMDFHHIDPATKTFGIGGNLSFSKEKLKAELDKCIMLCSNCHREFHEGMLKLEDFSRGSSVVRTRSW